MQSVADRTIWNCAKFYGVGQNRIYLHFTQFLILHLYIQSTLDISKSMGPPAKLQNIQRSR